MDAQTSKTKRTFADIQHKVLHDTSAGSKANPLNVSGAFVPGKSPVGCCIHESQTENLVCDRAKHDVNNQALVELACKASSEDIHSQKVPYMLC